MSLKIKIHDKNAIIPSKAGPSEVGYDLTAITFMKRLNGNTFMYDTGVSVEPPEGYYTEIVPRSSIVKSGFMLSNSVGIIDPTYRGTLKVVLTKTSKPNKNAKTLGNTPLLTPFTLCQLVVRKHINMGLEVVNDLTDTSRGAGSFGSTNKK